MAKILFDIAAAQETADWLQCQLVMEISQRNFSYAVTSSDNKLLQLRFYELDARNSHDTTDEISGILQNDNLLKAGMRKASFVYNFPESQLVPENYFSATAGPELMELLHGDLNKGLTLSERVPGTQQYNIFRVPADLHGLMQRYFANGKYWHYYSLLLQSIRREEKPDQLSVIFYPNRMLVAVLKEKQLQLLQSYHYEAAEDVGYYLLNICGQLQLPPATTPVVLSGMIDASSVLYTEIFKYFGETTLEDFTGIEHGQALQDFPPHFFSPLLKLALCV